MLFQNRLPVDSILDNYVVGRKADVDKIVNLLTGSDYQQLTLVSILGVSGVGKTTVAKLVCQKVMALTKKPFDVQIWLRHPVNSSCQNILKEMFLALNASMGGLTNHVAILQQVKKELTSKKFLLVLDHVSNEIIEHWDNFKILLSRICTNNGNAILVTTCSQNVSSLLMGVPSTSTHQLDSFFIEECWLILKERAFRNVIPRKKINNLINLKRIAFSYEHQMPFGLGKLNGLETLPFFVVGLDCGGSIEELEGLNKLRGNLKITRLEEVGDKREVERANLQGKAEIQGLDFELSYGANDRSLRDEEVLEGLQPHRSIRRLKIKYCMGEKWSSWMLRIKSDFIGVTNNLVDLSLERCWNCVQLPRLGDLPHLQFLKMNHMGKAIDSASSSIGCLRLFPALKSLSISRMENLTEWSSPLDGSKVVVFPCLENLSIQSCPKLTGFPMCDLSELVKLEVRDCEELRLLFDMQQSFAFLTSLSVVGCSKLTEFPNLLLANMCFKELSVRRCEWLTFIPNNLGKLSYLTSLEIFCCKRLRYFPEEILCKLTQLQNLSIGAFSEELNDFRYLNQIKDLPCLEELEIWGSDFSGREMPSLPNQLQHLSVLKSLKIMGFTAMEDLPEWLTNLQSLNSLSLNYCRHLGCQSTAEIIKRLSSIRDLHIGCCPILVESKINLLSSLHSRKIKVEFSDFSKIRERLGLIVE